MTDFAAERLAFLRAICAAPGDDTPRLVYADWLQEHGEEDRAEFIRVQCELARRGLTLLPLASLPSHLCKTCNSLWILWPEDRGWSLCSAACGPCCNNAPMDGANIRPITPDEQNLLRRERELLTRDSIAWLGELPPLRADAIWRGPTDRNLRVDYLVWCEGTGTGHRIAITPTFRRGFVESVRCTWEDWLAHADELFWHPSQTVECPLLAHDRVMTGGRLHGAHCAACRGTGRVPRPCPATAQPIIRVTLTTEQRLPVYESIVGFVVGTATRRRLLAEVEEEDDRVKTPGSGQFPMARKLAAAWLRLEFPGVTFDLPPISGTGGTFTVGGQVVPVSSWSMSPPG